MALRTITERLTEGFCGFNGFGSSVIGLRVLGEGLGFRGLQFRASGFRVRVEGL